MKRIEIPSWVERLLGMGPVAPPPHVFGLDREGLRYARLVARGGDRLTLAEHHLAPLPPGLVSDVSGMGGALADAAALAAAVRQLRERASAPFADASLVVPDDWLHLTFVEVGELPRQAEARLEVLRWKLRKSLPFRIEDLRLVAREVAPRPGQAEPRRLMVGYGLEALLAGLEEAFAGEGVRLGCITHRSGALLAAAAAATDQAPLAALLAAGGRGYTLLVVRGGEPVVYRHKSLDAAGEAGDASASIARDLRLTRAFLAEQLPGEELARVLLFAPGHEEAWGEAVAAGLGVAASPLGPRHLPAALPAGVRWEALAPLVGAVAQEIA